MPRASRIGLGAAFVSLLAPLAVHASAAVPGANALDRYLSGLNSLSAAFTQTVTNGEGTQTEAGSGKLLVQRPGRFRWDYAPAEADGSPGNEARSQVLVADGKNLWFYDRELAQITVKPVETALSATPIVLLSGSAAQLHDSFDISAGAAHDGLDWVEVKPRSAEADFVRAQLGFSGDKLARMIVNDRLGQTVQLDFSHSERNARIDAARLKFQPPAGVDVIGTPQG
ncbi:MAG TPA: outer membrane lipoprotein chaperone LolA [Steroidobacteraceae bacterium]|jgi:outer membrane lipoprotein carrier protein|nr:outer membrane lipoprotein chaperone LolA [Steroidobacteraceae bacterium]